MGVGELFVGGDLVEGEAVHVGAGLPGFVPVDEPVEGGVELEARVPGELGAGAAGVEFEVAGFVDGGVFVEDPGGVVAPVLDHAGDDPADGLGVVVGGAEVEGGGVAGGAGGEEVLGELDVAEDGFEDVLPGADGVGAADADGLAGEEAADEVGDEAVGGPVAAADDVAGACGGDGAVVVGDAVDGEVTLAEGGGDDLGAGLGAGVGVVAAERVGFAVAPEPLFVFVALVGGDAYHGSHAWRAAYRVEDACGAEDVGLEGADGVVVGVADEGLGGEVEDDLGSEAGESFVEGGGVADVAADVFDDGADAGFGEEVGGGAGVE